MADLPGQHLPVIHGVRQVWAVRVFCQAAAVPASQDPVGVKLAAGLFQQLTPGRLQPCLPGLLGATRNLELPICQLLNDPAASSTRHDIHVCELIFGRSCLKDFKLGLGGSPGPKYWLEQVRILANQVHAQFRIGIREPLPAGLWITWEC